MGGRGVVVVAFVAVFPLAMNEEDCFRKGAKALREDVAVAAGLSAAAAAIHCRARSLALASRRWRRRRRGGRRIQGMAAILRQIPNGHRARPPCT